MGKGTVTRGSNRVARIAGLAAAGLSAAALTGTIGLIAGAAPALAQPGGDGVIVANTGNNSITEYAPGASGNVAPAVTILGTATGLDIPTTALQGPDGTLYVSNAGSSGPGSVTEYAPGASGNASPSETIAGTNTGLDTPDSVALDSSGDLYVANGNNNSVTEYAQGASGNATPVATIAGANTGLSSPETVVVDGAGHIYVTNLGTTTVTEYAPGASGDILPIATIVGANTGLNGPIGAALDSSDNLFVTDYANNAVTEYPDGASGDQPPSATLAGSNTLLDSPYGAAVDASDNLYVANYSSSAVTEYGSTIDGDIVPTASISGSNTGLNGPDSVALAVTPSVSVSCSPSSVVVGQSTLCTATVTDAPGGSQAAPSGAVTFTSMMSGPSDSRSCQLTGSGTSASCQASFTPTLADTRDVLTAAYGGDSTHPAASGTTPLDVSVRSDTVSISCPATASPGQTVNCTATVTDTDQAGSTSSPPGKITFTSNTSQDVFSGSPCTLEPNGDNDSSSCQASVTLAAGKPHVHVIAARYGYYEVFKPGVGKTQINAAIPPTKG